ncbi:MAG: HAMP domain-containing sensor histidine kinase [Deltaproteobacteria bacterium]|nr:HAMP domain-containing sensor histidine kinase [Deltaproteobacteria bacterium]
MSITPPFPPSLQKGNQQQPAERCCPCLPFLPRSIKGKLIFSLIIISVLGITATASAIYGMLRIEEKVRIIESFFELNQNVLEMRRYEKNYLLYNNKKDLISALDYIDQVRVSIGMVKKLFPGSEEDLQSFYNKELGKYESISQQLMAEDLLLSSKKQLKETLRTLGQDITKRVFDLDAQARIQVEREVVTYQKTGVLILALTILVGGILIYFLLRWIIRPLTAIREAAAQIMQGKMNSIPINEAVSCSEEGVELVNSLNLMLKTLNTKQDQLVQSEKLAAIGKVTAGIAHEINNPLNNISLTAEAMLEDLPDLSKDDTLEMIHDILAQSDRAREVVHHLLEFSRAHKNNATVRVDLVKLVTDSIALVRNQFRLGEITYNYQHPDQPLLITGTPPNSSRYWSTSC